MKFVHFLYTHPGIIIIYLFFRGKKIVQFFMMHIYPRVLRWFLILSQSYSKCLDSTLHVYHLFSAMILNILRSTYIHVHHCIKLIRWFSLFMLASSSMALIIFWYVVKPAESPKFGSIITLKGRKSKRKNYDLSEEAEPNHQIPNTIPLKKRIWKKKGKLVDLRTAPSVPFEKITYPKVHLSYYVYEKESGEENAYVIIDEVFWEAMRMVTRICNISKFDTSTADRIMARMTLIRDEFNIPNHYELEFADSVRYAIRNYELYMQSRKEELDYLNKLVTAQSILNGSKGRFYNRLFRRCLDHEEYSKCEKLLKLWGCSLLVFSLTTAFGYVWRQIPLEYQEKKIEEHSIKPRLQYLYDNTVKPVAFSLLSYFNPRPDISNFDNIISGRETRLNNSIVGGVHLGKPLKDKQAILNDVVNQDLLFWKPISFDTPENWLKTKKYPLAKKEKIINIYDQPYGRNHTPFIKWESYDGFKSPRIISNTSKLDIMDEGPIVSALEEQFEQLPSILSGKKVDQWGQIVKDKFSNYSAKDYKVVVTDHSSFEGSISPEIRSLVEDKIYERVLSNAPKLFQKIKKNQLKTFYKQVKDREGYLHTIRYQHNVRSSGDARTYQANSLLNHYLIKAVQRSLNFSTPYFVSGDDGIMLVPRHVTKQELVQEFANFGFKTKCEETALNNSGFCGFSFNEDEPRERICNHPIHTVIDLFASPKNYTTNKYRNYLYDKALCLLHEYYADPILNPVLKEILKHERHYNISKYRTDWWNRYIMEHSVDTRENLLTQKPVSWEIASDIYTEPVSEEFATELVVHICDFVRAYFSGNNMELVTKRAIIHNLLERYDQEHCKSRFKYNLLQNYEDLDSLYSYNKTVFAKIFN